MIHDDIISFVIAELEPIPLSTGAATYPNVADNHIIGFNSQGISIDIWIIF